MYISALIWRAASVLMSQHASAITALKAFPFSSKTDSFVRTLLYSDVPWYEINNPSKKQNFNAVVEDFLCRLLNIIPADAFIKCLQVRTQTVLNVIASHCVGTHSIPGLRNFRKFSVRFTEACQLKSLLEHSKHSDVTTKKAVPTQSSSKLGIYLKFHHLVVILSIQQTSGKPIKTTRLRISLIGQKSPSSRATHWTECW